MQAVNLTEVRKAKSKTKQVFFTPEGRRFHMTQECRGLLRGGHGFKAARVPVETLPASPAATLHLKSVEDAKPDKLPCQVCTSSN